MNTIIGTRSSIIIADDLEETYVSPLTRALACWKHGKGISMVLAAELLNEGYDVQALERRHRA